MHQSHYCQHTQKKDRNQLTSDSGGQSYVALSLLCTSISRDNGVSTKYYSAGSGGGRIVHVIFQELMIQCRMLIDAHVVRKHTQINVFMLQ